MIDLQKITLFSKNRFAALFDRIIHYFTIMYFELDVVMVMIRENTFFYMQMVYSLSFVRIVH